MCDESRFKHPFTCIISGPTGSGKVLCWLYAKSRHSVYRKTFDGVYSGTRVRRQLSSRIKKCKESAFSRGVPDFANEHGSPCLFVLDDVKRRVFQTSV